MPTDHQEPTGAAAVIDQQRRDYLNEHLPYEMKMLRYTYGQMQHRQHYLSWNAHYESFAVHARNLVNLLTNGDTGNFKASDFVPGYRARIGDAQGSMGKLRTQVFHLGKKRPRTVIDKFNTEPGAKEVVEWIEICELHRFPSRSRIAGAAGYDPLAPIHKET